ncbi:enoyl-CoA hydratase/isomerase family protein [Herbiconiux moechotypicola]|uniref:Enoyl-CoA hydratase/isomerase family protein n=1 Tax=Herbiconiux moechotypicola TaxID=637393 RepID=A0ABN3DHS1_9MICO|nr:enoyl-CoA hydratase/isomerase family protein [Herbiconiux moechotypicola]MCS5729664.1 enoyl-CoA hydratase/isomerase family protein [Herbiconiux moechotypicola]
MTTSSLHYERLTPQTARVTFANAPVNLVVGALAEQLTRVLDELAADEQLQVLEFDSAVPDFFLNHFDLAHLADFPPADAQTGREVWTDIAIRLAAAPYITVARIRGRTRGGGNELALALDLRYASIEKAFFGQPEVGTAVVPGGGGTERLPRLIGRDRALEAVLTSQDYDAVTAERWGWVTRALPDAELDGFVDGVVARLAAFDRTALATAKAMVNRASLPPESDLVAAYGEFVHTTTLPGYRERAAGAPAPTGEQALQLEYHLGEFLGQAALRRAAAAASGSSGSSASTGS